VAAVCLSKNAAIEVVFTLTLRRWGTTSIQGEERGWGKVGRKRGVVSPLFLQRRPTFNKIVMPEGEL